MRSLIYFIILINFSLLSHAQGKVDIKSMNSKVLGMERNYSVFLPKSYAINTEKKYPVLYLLHGVFGNHTDWAEDMNLEEVTNLIIDAENAKEMIIIMPDAGTEWNGYFNMEGWAYETYFFEEFIPYIEKIYRVIPDKMHRAIAGLSMGGGGATVYAQKHPEMFSSVYASSALFALPDDGGIPFEDFRGKELNRTVEENNCIDFLKEADPLNIEKLKKIRWFIDCGDDDFILYLSFRFANEMKYAGIPFQMRVRDGDHTSEYWHTSLYHMLPFISNGFRDN